MRWAVAALLVAASLAACSDSAEPRTPRTFALPGRPAAVAVTAQRVWIADDAGHAVHELDPDSGRLVARVSVDTNPLAIAASGDEVWIAHAAGTVTRLRPRGTVTVGGQLTGIAMTADAVWVADFLGNAIVRVNRATLEVGPRIAVSAGAVRLAIAGQTAWVTNLDNSVTRVDLAKGTSGRPIAVGDGPIGVAADNREAWVANSDSDAVSRLRAGPDGISETAIAVGRAPVAVALSREMVWVANQVSRSVTAIERDTLDPAQPIAVQGRPRALAARGRTAWIVTVDPSAAIRVGAP